MMKYTERLQKRVMLNRLMPERHVEMSIIPYLVKWLFQNGLPDAWGKNVRK